MTLARRIDSLTHAQQDLARYILDHNEPAAFMTARQLADAVGQSDAAVVRFAQAVGYTGYPELRTGLRGGLLESTSSTATWRTACAKKALAMRRMSLARRSSRFSRSNSFDALSPTGSDAFALATADLVALDPRQQPLRGAAVLSRVEASAKIRGGSLFMKNGSVFGCSETFVPLQPSSLRRVCDSLSALLNKSHLSKKAR